MARKTVEPARKEKLSIYLVKENLATTSVVHKLDDDLIKIQDTETDFFVLPTEEGEARLYVKKDKSIAPPPWTKLFTSLPEVPLNAFSNTQSVGAVLVYKSKRTFLLSFGTGFHLIRDSAVERDFGLRVTLNSVEPTKLRSLDKASYSDNKPLNSRTQSSRDVDIFDLDMDSETEMLYAVTGASKEENLGPHITGRDALTLMVETDFSRIPGILAKALEQYEKKLPPEFEWVDNIHKVRDLSDVAALDIELEKEIASNGLSIWLGEPEIVDWEAQYAYSFERRSKANFFPILQLSDLCSYMNQQGKSITIEELKSQQVHVNNSEYRSIKCWPAYRCLYAEVSLNEKQYLLRNGHWYQVKESFVKKIDDFLKHITISAIPLPTYNHDREEDYNQYVAAQDRSFEVMDKKNTRIGGPNDKIEFCDLIKDQKTLVHVKYYRSSATLSHLFAQGNVAAETFVQDEEFRLELNKKLPTSAKLKNPKSRPIASDYTVVYAIATAKTLPQQLPFFSKVTLKNALRTLEGLNFKCELATIAVDPELLLKKKGRPTQPEKKRKAKKTKSS